MILLTPGPCMTSDSVRAAAALPDWNHREPAFLELSTKIRDFLAEQSGGMHPFVLGGSGTAAMEAFVSSCLPGKRVLVLADGYYSERMAELLEIHEVDHEVLQFPWIQGWDMTTIGQAMAAKTFDWVIATHHETTTGRLNPVEALAALTAPHKIKIAIDAMSSLGIEKIPWPDLDAVVGSANKGYHGLPGVSFVLLRAATFSEPPRSFYLNLSRYAGLNPPLTPPIPALRAFGQAIQEYIDTGAQVGRHQSYQAKVDALRQGLLALNYPFLLEEAKCSVATLTVELPPDSTYAEFFDQSYERGYVIYGCKGELAERYFQVSPMGEVTVAMIQTWLNGLPPFLTRR